MFNKSKENNQFFRAPPPTRLLIIFHSAQVHCVVSPQLIWIASKTNITVTIIDIIVGVFTVFTIVTIFTIATIFTIL